jgi:ACS family hexuronate transporter-like MFS transporter
MSAPAVPSPEPVAVPAPLAPAAAGPTERWRWLVVWLMFLATMINYMDRITVNATASYLKKEFRLDEQGYGWVEFAFGLSYGVFQILAGVCADRFSLRWLYAGSLLVWSAAGVATGFAPTVAALIVSRIVLGAGEAFNWPCAVAVVRRTLPREARSTANGIFHSGGALGAVLTPLVVLALVAPGGEGWRSVFWVVGGVGAVWVVLWLGVVTGRRAEVIDTPAADEAAARAAKPARGGVTAVLRGLLELMTLGRFWIALAVGLTVNIGWHFHRVWFGRYLEKDLKFDGRAQQLWLMWFFVAAGVGCLLAGTVTRWLGGVLGSVERGRQAVMFGTAGLSLLSAPAVLIGNTWVALALLLLAAVGFMGGFANYFALLQEVSARQTALTVGVLGFVSWVAIAVLGPAVGKIADQTGTFVPVFVAVGFVPMFGSVLALLWTPAPSGNDE